jgi:hypothetical protein
MPYVPQQVPGNLLDFDALRKWTEEEFQRLGRAYADDELLDATNLAAVQTDVATIETQILKADDIISGSGSVALTTNIAAQVATISVLAGTWDIEAFLQFSGNGSTVTTNLTGAIDPVTATIGVALPDTGRFRSAAGITDLFMPMRVGPKRVVLGGTTNYFLNAVATFVTSTYAASGIIVARRIIT